MERFPINFRDISFIVSCSIVVAFLALVVVACQKESGGLTSQVEVSQEDEKLIKDLEIIGQLHNEGLEAGLQQFVNYKDKNGPSILTAPLLIKKHFADKFAADYVNTRFVIEDKEKFQRFISEIGVKKVEISPAAQYYLNQLRKALNASSLEEIHLNLDNVMREGVTKISDQKEKVALIAGVQTAKYSAVYWLQNKNRWESLLKGKSSNTKIKLSVLTDAPSGTCHPCPPLQDLIHADAEGAFLGAIEGAIVGGITTGLFALATTGPVGAVNAALTGAIVGGMAGAVGHGVASSVQHYIHIPAGC